MLRRLGGLGLLLLLALLAVPATLPSGSAQGAGWGPTASTDTTPGVLYFKPQAVDTEEAPLCSRNAERLVPVHAISESPPSSLAAEEVHDDRHSAEAIDCVMIFQYEVDERFVVTEGVTVSVWMNCHRPTPLVGDPGTDGRISYNWAFLLAHNGDHIARYDGSQNRTLPAGACSDVLNPDIRFNGVLDPGRAVFDPGDTLQVWVAIFHQVSPGNTTYLHVDGYEAPSAVYGAGLPGTLRADPTSTLWMEPANTTARTGPGNATSQTYLLHNDGVASRTVDLHVDGAADWPVVVEPAGLEVPAHGQASFEVTSAAPPDAPRNATATHHVTLSSQGEELAFETATRAVPGQGSPSDLIEPASQGAGSGDGLLPSLISELWVEILATTIVAAMAPAVAYFLQ